MEQEELIARLQILANEYGKEIETVNTDFTACLAIVSQSKHGKRKSLVARIKRALRKVENDYLDKATKSGVDTDIFILGFLPPKDRNAGIKNEIISDYLENPSNAPIMISDRKIASTIIIDDEGNKVVKEQLDELGRPIPLDSETGEELAEDWSSALICIVINEKNEFSPLTFVWVNGERANPKSPLCILSKDILMQKVKASIKQSKKSGSLSIDRTDLQVYASTPESQEEAIEYLLDSPELSPNRSFLSHIQEWFDASEKYTSPKTGTKYGRDICVTTGTVRSIFMGTASTSANIKIYDDQMSPELKKWGYTCWLPDTLADIDVGGGDDVIIVGKITQKTTNYNWQTRSSDPAPDGNGDLSFNVLGIFAIWPDEEVVESPAPISQNAVESEIKTPRKFTAATI